jgi:hypothetical protein
MNQYKSFFEVLYVYWRIYGGGAALFLSPYFHISVLVALLCYPLWWGGNEWASLALGAIPNLLGFSVGAFAVILSFGQGSIDLLKNPDEAKSRYLGVVASFVHFILIQALTLIVALLGKAWDGKIIGAIGCTLFVYAIVLSLAAAMRLFRLTRIYNQLNADKSKVPPQGR